MKFKFEFTYSIRDVYHKHGFGYDQFYSFLLQSEMAELVSFEIYENKLPYKVNVVDDGEVYLEIFDLDGTMIDIDNEPDDLKSLLDSLDELTFEELLHSVDEKKKKTVRKTKREQYYEEQSEEFKEFLDKLED